MSITSPMLPICANGATIFTEKRAKKCLLKNKLIFRILFIFSFSFNFSVISLPPIIIAMIRDILEVLSKNLEDYLQSLYPDEPGNFISLGSLGDPNTGTPNKIFLSLLCLDRETAGRSANRSGSTGTISQSSPSWQMNLNVILACLYDSSNYPKGLRLLSSSLAYFQQHLSFPLSGKTRFTLEPVTPSIQELSQIWGIMGWKYHPSLILKIRGVDFCGKEVVRQSNPVTGSANGVSQ